MKVHIQNFQSAQDVEMEIDGLTVVVGKSNIGKSALRRAIQGALTNLKGDYFITHGKQYAQVQIQCPEIDLTWKKGGTFNDYEIDGTSYNNVGHGTPEAIAEAGFRLLETNAGTLDVQIADQFRPLFLLQETGSLVAEAISDVGRLGDIQKALKTCEKDRRSVKSEKKIREGDLVEAQASLESYDDLEADLGPADSVADLLSQAQTVQREVEILTRLQEQKAKIENRMAALKPVTSIPIPDEVGSLTGDLDQCKKLDAFHLRLLRSSEVYKSLKGVEDVAVPEVDITQEVKVLATLSGLNQRLQKVGPLYKALRSVSEVQVPEFDVETSLRAVKDLQHLSERISVTTTRLPNLKQELDDMDISIQKAEEDVHQALHEAGHCPTCEQVVP